MGDSSAEVLALACAGRNVASWTHRVLLLADDSLLLNGLAGDDVWLLLGGVPGARRGLRSYAQRAGGPRSELHLWRSAEGVSEHTAPCFANTFVFVSAGQPAAATAAEVADTLGKAVATQAAYATLCAMGVIVYRFTLQEGGDSGADAALLQQACEEALEGAGLVCGSSHFPLSPSSVVFCCWIVSRASYSFLSSHTGICAGPRARHHRRRGVPPLIVPGVVCGHTPAACHGSEREGAAAQYRE